MEITTLKQTKCLPGQHAIHVEHGWCEIWKTNGMQRTCVVEDGPNSYEFGTDVRDLRIVDPRRDLSLKPTQSARVMASIHLRLWLQRSSQA